MILPQWIERMYPPKKGRDHLGLGSVSSDQILQSLAPGINVLTDRPRYHSFYTFLLDEFWRRERPRTKADWIKFYRPREFIFSLGNYLCDRPEHNPESGAVGGQKTGSLAARKNESYRSNFNYIKEPLGGYGLYYRSVIAELGFIYPGGPGLAYRIDVPTDEEGKGLAEAFRQAVKETRYYQEFFEEDDVDVPAEVIREYINSACFCQLRKKGSPDRELLLKQFLHGGHPDRAFARRQTLRFMLDVARATDGVELDEDQFRVLLYFGTLEGERYRRDPAVEETYKKWRLYQAREYYAYALNGLWYYLAEWGLGQAGDVRPVALIDWWAHLRSALDVKSLAKRLKLAPVTLDAASPLKEILAWLTEVVGATPATFDAKCSLDSPVNENLLYETFNQDEDWSPSHVSLLVVLLLLVYLRFSQKELRLRTEWQIAKMGMAGRLSLDGFVRATSDGLKLGWSLYDFAHWIINDYVILQHQLVATSKLPDNTFRFEREGNRLRFHNFDNQIRFNNSRFNALKTTVFELGLAGDLSDPSHGLTAEGRHFLKTGDLV